MGLLHVMVEPVPAAIADKQVFLALAGVQPDREGMLRRVRTESKFKAVHSVTAFQKAAVLPVKAQGFYGAVKLRLKLPGRFIAGAGFPYRGESLADFAMGIVNYCK